jgi:hypothetical protein
MRVCNSDTFDAPSRTLYAQSAQTILMLPASFTITEHATAQAASFSDSARGVYGYVVRRAFTEGAQRALQDSEAKLAGAGFTRGDTSARPFTTWTGHLDDLTLNALRGREVFRFGEGTDNPHLDGQSPDSLRDQLISALSGVEVAGPHAAPPCDTLISHRLEEVREGDTLISLGVIACVTDYSQPDNALLFDDLLSGTLSGMFTQWSAYTPHKRMCPSRPAERRAPDLLDLLWVFDEASALRGAQAEVAQAVDGLFDLLLSSSADWRVAVTTTDAYCLGLDPEDLSNPIYERCRARLAPDPIRDPCTGLRSLNGFMNRSTVPEREVIRIGFIGWVPLPC